MQTRWRWIALLCLGVFFTCVSIVYLSRGGLKPASVEGVKTSQ